MTNNGKPSRPPPPRFLKTNYRVSDAITGAALAAAIDATPEVRPTLVEGLIIQHSINIVSSPTGHGKSCLMLMIATQGSVAMPVFGDLTVQRPLTSYIFCPERPAEELRERLRKMKRAIPYDLSRIVLDEGMMGLIDITREPCFDSICQAIDRNCPHGIDIFFVDGLYGMSRKPLADEETANAILRFNSRLIREFGCSIYYNHHWAKTKYDKAGLELPPNPFGSVFLYANATGTFLFERAPIENQSTLKLAKDTVSGLIKEFTFVFDPESFTMTLASNSTCHAQQERLRRYANACLQTGKTFTYAEILPQSNLRIDAVRKWVNTRVKENKLINLNSDGTKALFKVLEAL